MAAHRARDPSKFTLTIGLNYLHGTFANDERLVAAGTVIAVAPAHRPLRLPAAVLLPRGGGGRRQGLTSRCPDSLRKDPHAFCRALRRQLHTPAKGGSTTGSTSTSTPYAPTSTPSPRWASTTSGSSRCGPTSSPTALIRPRAVEQLLQLVDAAESGGSTSTWTVCRGTCRASTSCRVDADLAPAQPVRRPEVLDGQAGRACICVRSPRPSPTARTSSA